MSNKTKAELISQADEIKNETVKGANTANRVGTMLNDIIDSTTMGGGVYGMDLDNFEYYMNSVGVFYPSTFPTYDVTFPDPNEFEGQLIYLINNAGDSMNISGINRPITLDGSQQPFINPMSTFVCCSINGNWVVIIKYIE